MITSHTYWRKHAHVTYAVLRSLRNRINNCEKTKRNFHSTNKLYMKLNLSNQKRFICFKCFSLFILCLTLESSIRFAKNWRISACRPLSHASSLQNHFTRFNQVEILELRLFSWARNMKRVVKISNELIRNQIVCLYHININNIWRSNAQRQSTRTAMYISNGLCDDKCVIMIKRKKALEKFVYNELGFGTISFR